MRAKRKRLAMACTALLVSTAAVALATASVAQADPGCQNGGVYVVWARGSNQDPWPLQGTQPAEAKSFHDNVFSALNAAGITTRDWGELGNFDGNFYPQGHVDQGEYPAVPATGIFNGSYDDSVFTGVEELISSLNNRYALGPIGMACNTETAVLGGFSQGADLIRWMLALTDGDLLFGYPIPTLTPAARNHIGFVALYGDPHFNVACGQNRPWVRANARCDSVPRLGARSPYLPSDFLNRTGSWCDDGDGICAVNNWTVGIGNHATIYRNSLIQQSATEIAAATRTKMCSFSPMFCSTILQMILDGSGQVWAKTSIGYGNWTQETPPGHTAIAAGSNGLQMTLDSAGQVWAKNNAPSMSWTQETPAGITAIAAGANGQQMILDSAGQVWAKQGIGYGNWTQETPSGITKIAMGDNGLQMILDSAGQVWAKNSIGYGQWTQETPAGITKIAAGDNGLQMILDSAGQVWAKTSIGYMGGWTQETPAGHTAISAGNYGLQMIIDSVGQVWARSSIGSSWTRETPSGHTAIAAGDANQQMLLDGAGQVWAQAALSMSWTQETPSGEVAIAAGG